MIAANANAKTMTSAVAFAIAMLGMMAAAIAEEDRMSDRRTLAVSGQGKISAAPDVADLNVGVVTEAETAREALSSNNQAMAKLTEQLKQRGVAAKDIQTSGINLNPKYSQPRQRNLGGVQQGQAEDYTPRIVGYSVTNSVRITARDLQKLGELLDSVVTAGANQMNGISFRVDEAEKLLDEARKRAVNDAKRKAEQLCGEVGMVLGAPIQINEGGGAIPPPRPMMARAMMMDAAESVPVSPGEQELNVSVQIVFEITRPD